MNADVAVIPVPGMPEVRTGDDLARLVVASVGAAGWTLERGDIVVVSSKVVSKAAGLWADDRTGAVAASTRRVVAERATPGAVTRIVKSTAGPVMAAAGVDASNTGGSHRVLVLPEDADAAAAALREAIADAAGLPESGIAVVITDTAGRPWRVGQTDFALGSSGIVVLDDFRGRTDADGRPLAVTLMALADEVAAAADLVKGKDRGVPAAVVRGLAHLVGDEHGSGALELVRSGPSDWFALGHVEAVRAALGVEPGSREAAAYGIRSTTEEAAAVRVTRAVAVALHGTDGEVGVDVGPGSVSIAAEDSFVAGWVTARLVAALWAEDLTGEVARPAPGSATVTIGEHT